MLEKVKEKLEIKWWEHFPVLGAMAYAIRVEFWLNNQEKIIKKNVKHYKGLIALITTPISITFLVLFFVLRNKHGFGSYPWFFWVGLVFGLTQNLTPYIWKFVYIKGVNKWQNEILEQKKQQ